MRLYPSGRPRIVQTDWNPQSELKIHICGGKPVKRHLLPVLAAVLLSSLSFASPKDKTYSGEIMDSACAKNGSHPEMLKKEGMGDKEPKRPMANKMVTQHL